MEEIIERQIESASHLLQLEKQANLNKKLKSDNIVEEFKFKRHQKQHELNQIVINKTEEAMETSGEDERLESLREGKDLLIQGNKHLVMADCCGWPVVEAYVDNPLASDSEGEKKIRCAITELKNV